MSSDLQTDEQLFFEAIKLPQEQRRDFVDRACANDVDRRNRVESLLLSHERNSDCEFMLDKPPEALLLAKSKSSLDGLGERAGDQIGRYRLLERIGEGGMGVVYMAEQTVGVRRRVALKVIKLGMDTRQVIAWFEAERQAMALFDHPNIAKVLDIGATDSGRPFFVLELVKGTSLTEFVENNQLKLEERLDLFVQVCNALQHAHQKGIIHRDLKPSNVLVTLYDGKPVPKVIDFGIAKAIGQQRLTDKTLFTRYAAMVGTPQYMSPEQAELTGMDVDTRTDIYSMGVLLYELVTGSTPIQSKDLASLNPLALYETLRDTEIEAPSARLTRNQKELESSPNVAAFTISSTRVKRELDWVILKALSRDRQQRYATANELAADVERFIEGETVLAGPPSKARWFGAFYRRNRAAVLASSAIALTLAIASVACFALAVNSLQANRKLNSVNGQLSENVTRLVAAESKLRQEAEQRKYDSAVSIANVKFETRFFQKVHKLMDEGDHGFFKAPGTLSQDDSMDDYDVTFMSFTCCTCYLPEQLLVFDHSGQLGDTVQRVQDVFDRLDEQNQTMFEAQYAAWQKAEQELNSNGEELEHSSECLQMQEIVDRQLLLERHQFFRILVEQYRVAFGEDDPHVAEALILLAACLEETGDVDEAESHVREAMAIGNEINKIVARRLLDRVKLKRHQLKNGK